MKIRKMNSTNKKNIVLKEGIIKECLPSTNFRVEIIGGGEALAHLSGKMRMYRIKILHGDRVKLELSPFDLTRGRIVYRF